MVERGRPKAFDTNAALDAALAVFWRDGYQAASMSALTEAMGINKPSLYATFGDKSSLYLKALERYMESATELQKASLDAEPDVRYAVEKFMLSAVESQTRDCGPNGCLVVNGATECGSANLPAAVGDALAAYVRSGHQALATRLRKGIDDGQLAPDTDADVLAGYFVALIHGLSVQARAGVGRESLAAMARASLKVLG